MEYPSFESEEEEEAAEDSVVEPLTLARGSLGRALCLKATRKSKAGPADNKERKADRREEDRDHHRRDGEPRAVGSRDGEEGDRREELPRHRTGSQKPLEPDHPPPSIAGRGRKRVAPKENPPLS